MPLLITTRKRPTAGEEREAIAAAARWGFPFVPRAGRTLVKVLEGAAADSALVLAADSARLFMEGVERPWSAGMGMVRMKRVLENLRKGNEGATERDSFVEAAGLLPGDSVLDCTVGLGADALTAAAAIGPAGRVVGLESSPVLAAWTAEGLQRLADEPARRVQVVHVDQAEFLRAAPERSYDVVVFDPMFRHARAEPGGFDVVRKFADARPLSVETLARARKVARRSVIVKDGAPGWDLARLGLTPLSSARFAHRYFARVPAN